MTWAVFSAWVRFYRSLGCESTEALRCARLSMLMERR